MPLHLHNSKIRSMQCNPRFNASQQHEQAILKPCGPANQIATKAALDYHCCLPVSSTVPHPCTITSPWHVLTHATPACQDPLAYIGILAIFFPFILLLLAIAAGYIDLRCVIRADDALLILLWIVWRAGLWSRGGCLF